MTTTYKVELLSSETYQVIEKTEYYGTYSKEDSVETIFQGSMADCAAFIQLRKAGHI
jgi:hypothetical protein